MVSRVVSLDATNATAAIMTMSTRDRKTNAAKLRAATTRPCTSYSFHMMSYNSVRKCCNKKEPFRGICYTRKGQTSKVTMLELHAIHSLKHEECLNLMVNDYTEMLK